MRVIKTLLCPFLIFSVSCASIHPGRMAVPEDESKKPGLKISANLVGAYSDKAHQFIDFTFENKETHWERIKSIDFSYGEENAVVYNVIVGDDLVTWANAMTQKKSLEDYNEAMALGGILLAGAVLTLGGKSQETRNMGMLAYGAGTAASLSYSIREDLRDQEASKLVPKTHLLNSFSVPAGLFVRRWILVNVPGDRWADYAYLTVNTVDGESTKYKVYIE